MAQRALRQPTGGDTERPLFVRTSRSALGELHPANDNRPAAIKRVPRLLAPRLVFGVAGVLAALLRWRR